MFLQIKCRSLNCYEKIFENIRNRTYLLQEKSDETSQLPFHLRGGGPYPWSRKLGDSGQIPVSSTPTMMSLSTDGTRLACWDSPMKSHDLVVWSCFFPLGKTDITPFISKIKKNIYIYIIFLGEN